MRSIIVRFLLLSSGLSLLIALPLWWLWFHHNAGLVIQQYRDFTLYRDPVASAERVDAVLADATERFHLPFNAWIIDEQGRPMGSSSLKRFPFPNAQIPLPETLDAPAYFARNERALYLRIYRLDGAPLRFLAMGYRPLHFWNFPIPIAVTLTTFLTALVSCLILVTYLRRKAKIAETVLTRMLVGDLSARLPVHALDEVGRFSLKFNRMADELELVVRRLKESQRSRSDILEELAHDLRTPLTAILTLFESIADRSELSPQYYKECIATAIPEIEYVNRLIQDLFLLAKMNEPKYEPELAEVDVRELLAKELKAIQSTPHPRGKSITYELGDDAWTAAAVSGDPHLLRRLFRNLLLNARRFAESRCNVTLRTLPDGGWEALFDDDGRGFDPKTLRSFGMLRPELEANPARKESLGLGSIIVHSIVRIHQGSLQAENRSDGEGRLTGARVVLRFPGRRSKQAEKNELPAPALKLVRS